MMVSFWPLFIFCFTVLISRGRGEGTIRRQIDSDSEVPKNTVASLTKSSSEDEEEVVHENDEHFNENEESDDEETLNEDDETLPEPDNERDIDHNGQSKNGTANTTFLPNQSKRANLSICFEKNTTKCYVGVNCMNPLAMKDEKTHGDIKLLKSPPSLSNPEQKKSIEECNVGAVFRHLGNKKYAFAYHTTTENQELVINMIKRKIAVDWEQEVLSCRPSCYIFMNKTESIRWKKEKFFSGYIVLIKRKILHISKNPAKGVSVQPKEKKENKNDLHTNVIPDTVVQSDELTKKGTGDKEKELNIIQCIHNKKSARRKNAIESAVQKARKNEPPRKESTPLISSKTPSTNQITESNSDRTV